MLYQSQRLWGIFVMVLIICAGSAGAAQTIVTHYEEDFSIFPNPEQGFYEYTDLNKLPVDIGRLREQGRTLIWGRINLEAYRNTATLPEALLHQIYQGFDIARDQGMKVIVRAAYGSKGPGGDYRSFADPSMDIIKGHLRQLEPVFAVNADVIALFEAGFVGPWGEWHSTSIARDYDRGRDMLLSILVELSLENRGFASLYNPRKVQIVMRHQDLGTQLVHDIIIDPRLWKPGRRIVIQEVVELAQDMSTGSYTVHLNLPDPYPSLQGDPRYSLRCANRGIWDAHTGYNTLVDGVTVSVQR